MESVDGRWFTNGTKRLDVLILFFFRECRLNCSSARMIARELIVKLKAELELICAKCVAEYFYYGTASSGIKVFPLILTRFILFLNLLTFINLYPQPNPIPI